MFPKFYAMSMIDFLVKETLYYPLHLHALGALIKH